MGRYSLTRNLMPTITEVKVIGGSEQLSLLLSLLEDYQDSDCLVHLYEKLQGMAKKIDKNHLASKLKPKAMYPCFIDEIKGIEDGILSFRLETFAVWVKSDYDRATELCLLFEQAIPGISVNMFFRCKDVVSDTYTHAIARWGKNAAKFWPKYIIQIPKRNIDYSTEDFNEFARYISNLCSAPINTLISIYNCVRLFDNTFECVWCGETREPRIGFYHLNN